MAATAEVIWILLGLALIAGALAHSVITTRQSHLEATGELISYRQVLASRRWRRAALPYSGVLLLGTAVSASIARSFVLVPQWLEGAALVVILSLLVYALVCLWYAGS